MVIGLKFQIWKGEGLYNLCSENKGADQLHGYCAADLCLCFHLCKKQVLSLGGSFCMSEKKNNLLLSRGVE